MIIENQKDAEFSSAFQPSQPTQASRFKRWLASIINGLVLSLMVGISFALGDFAGVLGTMVYIGFQLYFMKTYGQTMAKRWLGLRVFNYHTNQPVEFGKYIGREIIDILLAWTSFLLIISGIVALVRDDRRSLTDLLAGTIVLKDEK
ncbi:TPA: RDD family protein [Haemophilus influenzae]|uniref:RDD family protein n=1 Tax=Haemophilus influenzae TaxID=727 RepID=UPI000D46FFB4|nr:RDD family protein [Haemophilus influenzae]PRI37226.1 RDD family protein [Haemophilus influenzae]PRJ57683.1 RDD family protein [Haemophilus influenzae]PRJ58729.1 RDD family protein [Haemophilus influenzae]PRM05635.1 RDD family protein [Haemophilus influenzae]